MCNEFLRHVVEKTFGDFRGILYIFNNFIFYKIIREI